MTAETHSIWMVYLAPTLLNGQFINEQYYKHFIQLVQLLTLCLEFKITQEKINDLERGGLRSMNGMSFYLCQTPSDKSAEFTINICRAVLHVAHSQFMLCCILLRPSELWAHFGLIGHFQWNATVVRFCTTSEADGSSMRASTSMLPPICS